MELFQSNPLMIVWLATLGTGVGFLTGLFGIGGAFIATPVMIALFGLDSSLAIGCSMGLTLANGLLGLKRHSGMGNIETRAMWPIALAACAGTLAGIFFHYQLKDSLAEKMDSIVNGMYVVLLIPIGLLVWWQSEKQTGKPLLSKISIPPMVKLDQEGLPPVSLTILALIGLTIGVMKGMLGIGGGIILVPILVLAVGMSPHRTVGTSLGMVVMSSIIGVVIYAWNGDINFFVVAALLSGSLFGVVIGSRFCNVTSPGRLKRLLAILILGFSLLLAYGTFCI